jgi:hypothetical protein
MSVVGAVVQKLRADSALSAKLGVSVLGAPAIFDTWSPQADAWPKIILTYRQIQADPDPKRLGFLDADIFGEGHDARDAEEIAQLVIIRLNRDHFDAGDDLGTIRVYYAADGQLPDEPGIVHWNISFTVASWPQRLIEAQVMA